MHGLGRSAKSNSYLLAFLCSVALLTALVGLLIWDSQKWFAHEPALEPLVVYCAAGVRIPVQAAAREYEALYGVPVRIQFGGSQTLLASLEVTQRGDLYIPADDRFLRIARNKGLIDEEFPLAEMNIVAVVRQGNLAGVHTLEDLLRDNLRLVQGDPDAAAVGTMTRATLQSTGQWDALKRNTAAFKVTVNDVANDVLLGSADVGIVWDSTVRQTPGLEAITLEPLKNVKARISVATLKHTTQPAAALQFAQYLAAREHGLKQFAKHGFEPAQSNRSDASDLRWNELNEANK